MANLSVPKNLELAEPINPDMPWIATVGDSTPLRITPDLVKVLKWHEDGKTAPLVDYVGVELDDDQLNEAVEVLKQFNLLTTDDPASTGQPAKSRLRLNSLFSIQFAILNRPANFAWLERFANRSFLVAAATINILFAVVGLLAIGLRWGSFYEALTTPQPPVAVLLLFVFLIVSVSVHEFAHGAVLTYFGGQVRRMGIMLFYLSPAFFCDVTDAWKLQQKNQRALVALAGVNATFGIAGLATIAYTLIGQGQDWLALASLALYFGSVLNLVPFIKLDGYIALMTYLDVPNLRARSMDEWKQTVVALLSGKWQTLAQFRLPAVLFGLAASATPIVILVMLATSLAGARAGLLGAVLGSAILIVVLALILRGIYRLSTTRIPRESVGTTARLWIAAVSLASTVAVGFVPVPVSSAGVYWESDGELVTNLEAPTANDARVTLRRDGLFASKPLGTAIITDEVVDTDMPVQALSPNIKVEGFPTRQSAYRMTSYEGVPIEEPGSVVFEAPSVPLGYLVLDTITLGFASDFSRFPVQSNK